MWKIDTLTATNLCAFRELHYRIPVGQTTLIFGHNLDNDSQTSNGSGKSALIEAIAIGLTGEPLRNIKRDEIINDAADEATVSLTLINDMSDEKLIVERTLSRKNPQQISLYTVQSDGTQEAVAQASVNDYNRYLLEQIGISKEELYAYFILSKHTFTSFLSSSDREKKEVINRFSNGVMVDESLQELEKDIQAQQQVVSTHEQAVSHANGRLAAINEQIAAEIAESAQRSSNRAQRIEELRNKVADKRAYIRQQEQEATRLKEQLNAIFDVEEEVGAIEEQNKPLIQTQEALDALFAQANLPALPNHTQQVADLQDELEETMQVTQKVTGILHQQQEPLYTQCEVAMELAEQEFKRFEETYRIANDEAKAALAKIQQERTQFLATRQTLMKQEQALQQALADTQKQLAGTITCPQCKHEFLLTATSDVQTLRCQLDEQQSSLQMVTEQIAQINQRMTVLEGDADKQRAANEQREQEHFHLSQALSETQAALQHANTQLQRTKTLLTTLNGQAERVKQQIAQATRALFDDAYAAIDQAIKQGERALADNQQAIDHAHGHIQTLQESIAEWESDTTTDLLERLQQSKTTHEQTLQQAMADHQAVLDELHKLQQQSTLFMEFKTHLANTKIDDLARITNEFLEQIGSDIRIVFSGYTLLKSGKVRDKISISLVREGVNCGSFDKFSEGEKARVNLANILAMHRLTNLHCTDHRGLDLLVLDEILDATDETGLASIFRTLDGLGVTSLVVSHGSVAENYPHKLIVYKQNGTSYLE